MREIHGHEINECNQAIAIVADEIGNGGASHVYQISYEYKGNPETQEIAFQDGPIKEVGTNGITQEVLLIILLDRLECFQAGPYACPENLEAIYHLRWALDKLHARTRLRDERGVEGTSTV